MTRAVLLDCLGTLVRLEPPAPRLRSELAARGVAVSEAAAEAAFRAEIAYYLEHHLQAADAASLERLRDACARVIADELGEETPALEPVREAMLAALRFSPYPDAADALRALRAGGLGIVVASNWDCSLPEVLERVGLLPLVDAVVTSAGVGAAKPAPGIFRAALAAAGTDARDAVCVGDSPANDVAGAQAAGIEAVLLVREAPAEEGLGGRQGPAIPTGEAPPGVPVVGSLDEVRALLLTRG